MDPDIPQSPNVPVTVATRATITATSAGPAELFRGASEPHQSGTVHEAAWNAYLPDTPRPLSPAAISYELDYALDVDEGKPRMEARLVLVWELFHIQSARRQRWIEQRAEQLVREAIEYSGRAIYAQSQEYTNLFVKTVAKLAERYNKDRSARNGGRASSSVNH